MIEIRNLNKKYQDTYVLKDINLSLPRNGLVVILGPSGCGKTTLLNCLSSLLDYDGDILIHDKNLKYLNDDEKSEYRLRYFGFVYQDFKLFDFETVFNNVLLPLDTISNVSRRVKKQKVEDLLELVDLKNENKQCVNKLSGGEKQRVGIARALVNDPKIILADEPTGALDHYNSEMIMNILKKISLKSLVIVVSHDEELAKRYSDIIIKMKDGYIEEINHKQTIVNSESLSIGKNLRSNKKSKVSFSFLLSHSKNNLKRKKWRTSICVSITSLGMIGVGLSTTLSSIISKNIKSAYSSLVDDSKIMAVRTNKSEELLGTYGGGYYEACEVAKKYPQYVMDVGVTYDTDFESFFPDKNEIALASTTYRNVIDGISIRHINEFRWLDFEKCYVYPTKPEYLNDDEVVFGLDIKMIQDICYALRIPRTIKALSHYLEEEELLFYFDLENKDWQYNDQQLLRMVGFTLENDSCIYHYNHLWNEYFIEEQLRFPTSDKIDVAEKYPWVMKKLYYFHTFGNTDDFLNTCCQEELLDDFILEIATKKYYPWMYRNVDIRNRHRVLFFLNSKKSISPNFAHYFLDCSDNLSKPIFGSDGGYAIYPYSLMMGFSHYTYFSCDKNSLDNTLDTIAMMTLYGNEESKLPEGVLSGHYTKTQQNGVIFDVFDDNLLSGRAPENLDEIVVSSNMWKELLNDENIKDPELEIAFSYNEKMTGENTISREFKVASVKIVGIIESDKNVIYQSSYWSFRFFQSRLDVSIFDLSIDVISFNLIDKNKMDGTISLLKSAFPYFDIVNPLSDINDGIERICFYVQIALNIFSIITVVISFLLLTISNYLHIIESRKDIGLARCLGISKKESKKFLYTHVLLISSFSYLLAVIQLIVLSIFISFTIADTLQNPFMYSINLLSFVYMAILITIISIISSLFVVNKMTKMNPLEAIKN